ncbi:GNAT family N-acetyltransferase [Vibrio sp. D431a]|uniref:GNAT family N-acetyltransferase n=1 Tax=Vibrio sp. D431a TaxID=2837388 RepID=UPI0025562337|nr:GNAT family N-acetyltransferase [Vibrio sp. D431a]MDK9789947.1 hypothetical protein [Vibrio sp. D431a]
MKQLETEVLRGRFQAVLDELLTKHLFLEQDFLWKFTTMEAEERNTLWKELLSNGYPNNSLSQSIRNIRLVHVRDYSTLELAIFDGQLRLSYIDSGNEKGIGNGTKMMNIICQLADNYKIPIALSTWTEKVGEENALRLVNFYRKFGFQISSRRKDLDFENLSNEDCIDGIPMLRQPSQTQEK